MILTYSAVIQGRADVDDGLTSKEEVSKAVTFTTSAVQGKNAAESTMDKPNGAPSSSTKTGEWEEVKEDALMAEEAKALKAAHKTFGDFAVENFGGRVARIERGKLGLVEKEGKE